MSPPARPDKRALVLTLQLALVWCGFAASLVSSSSSRFSEREIPAQPKRCATDALAHSDVSQRLRNLHSDRTSALSVQRLGGYSSTEHNINTKRGVLSDSSVFTIPVVFHVLYSSAAENVPESALDAQISVLNEDFSLTNPDRNKIDVSFAKLLRSTKLTFVKAGVVRKQTASTSFSTFDAIAAESTPWATSRHLNIYTATFTDGSTNILGAASLPYDSNATDFIIVAPKAIGRGGGWPLPPFELGRTATHETGHWLGLEHVWGPSIPSCDTDDFVSDTPNSGTEHTSCAQTSQLSCNSKDMVQNFMDYQDDACMHGFTAGQVFRMRSHLQDAYGWRRTLVVPNCGDGVVQDVEECDDGDYESNDGCTLCTVDVGYVCNSTSCSPDPALLTCPVFYEPFANTGPVHTWTEITTSGSTATPVFRLDSSLFATTAWGTNSSNQASWKGDMSGRRAQVSTTSPTITLPTYGNVIALSFWIRLDTQPTQSMVCSDAVRLSLIDVGTSQEFLLHSDNFRYFDVGTVPFTHGWCHEGDNDRADQGPAAGALLGLDFKRVSVDLTGFRGKTVRLRFEFITDNFINSGAVHVDEIRVMAPCPPASSTGFDVAQFTTAFDNTVVGSASSTSSSVSSSSGTSSSSSSTDTTAVPGKGSTATVFVNSAHLLSPLVVMLALCMLILSL